MKTKSKPATKPAQPAHTPLPWRIGLNPGPMIYSPCDQQVADCRGFLDHQEAIRNARLIVRAVNRDALFDELVAALAGLVEWMDDSDLSHTAKLKRKDSFDIPRTEFSVVTEARAALAKANA